MERHGHKSMTVSNGFNFRAAKRGLRRIFVRTGRQEGSTLFEFGMVVPLLSIFLVGIIYGGITFYDNVVLANAVAIGARALATGQGDATVCTDANSALQAAAYGLNTTSQLYIVSPPTFTAAGGGAGTSSCKDTNTSDTNPVTGAACSPTVPCQILIDGEFATMTATYPCSLYFPSLGINLCPVLGTAGKTPNPQCPNSPYCISSTATVRIE